MKLEGRKQKKNILVWNATVNYTGNAKTIFDNMILSGLGIHEIPNYMLAYVKPEKKLIKVTMGNMELKIAFLKQAQNLRDYYGKH